MDTQSWRDKARYFEFEGHQIAYWTGGNDKAKPLLLVHGFPTCAFDWSQTWQALGANLRLIACDLLGFDLSDKPKNGFAGKGYTIHRQTNPQPALLKRLPIRDFDALVQYSGFTVGQEILPPHPDGYGISELAP